MKAEEIELGEKEYLYLKETIRYFHLRARKFYALIREYPYDFEIMYRSRMMINRKKFAQFLRNHPDVEEVLVIGS